MLSPFRLFALLSLALLAGLAHADPTATTVTVLDPTPGATRLRITPGDLQARAVDVGGAAAVELSLPAEGHVEIPGAPRVPRISRSVLVPGDAVLAVRVLSERHHDLPGVRVAPSRGAIPRTTDKQSVPYVEGPAYSRAGWYPAAPAELREPYILRQHRGVVLDVHPVQYDPSTQTIRVYEELVLLVESVGTGGQNTLDANAPLRRDRNFDKLYANHFVNWVQPAYPVLDESGDMLIISHGPFMAAMQPLVDWKNAKGVPTTIVDVATIGNNASAIKNYISSVYNSGNLAYVLLVGDVAQVASGSYAGGLSDPYYSTITPDWYPDLFVGRFSAQNVAQVETQVQRTIAYEQLDHSLAAGGWNTRAMGIASDQGPGHYGEYDFQHMNNIRSDLLAYGFTQVDQIYDPSASASMVTSGLNNGRRLVNYCGHGSEVSWGTTGFSVSNVNQLQNDNLLPVIHSVACVNGAFGMGTCFGEAWLRATHNGNPTGAAAAYMSSINQYWDEPMYAQDATCDLFCAETHWSIGALWFGGSCEMMDITGVWGQDMFMTWILFGDPSLEVQGGLNCEPPPAPSVRRRRTPPARRR